MRGKREKQMETWSAREVFSLDWTGGGRKGQTNSWVKMSARDGASDEGAEEDGSCPWKTKATEERRDGEFRWASPRAG